MHRWEVSICGAIVGGIFTEKTKHIQALKDVCDLDDEWAEKQAVMMEWTWQIWTKILVSSPTRSLSELGGILAVKEEEPQWKPRETSVSSWNPWTVAIECKETKCPRKSLQHFYCFDWELSPGGCLSLSIWVRRSLGGEVEGERNRGNALCLSYNGTPTTLLCNSFPVFLCLSFPAYRVKLFYFSSTICPSTRVPPPVTLSTLLKFHPGAEKKTKFLRIATECHSKGDQRESTTLSSRPLESQGLKPFWVEIMSQWKIFSMQPKKFLTLIE